MSAMDWMVGLTALALSAAVPSDGHRSPAPTSDADVTVTEVVVRPALPIMWRVTKGSSVVWVLGATDLMPEGQSWNAVRLDVVLDGAADLIEPADATPAIFKDVGEAAKASGDAGSSLIELPEPLRTRYYALRSRLNVDPHKWDTLKPGLAALMLVQDMRKSANLTALEPYATAARLARARRVPLVAASRDDARATFNELSTLPTEAGYGVLADAVDAVEFQLAHAPAAAQAWARGDVESMRANLGADLDAWVLRRTRAYRAVRDRNLATATSRIKDALAKPGTSVAVLRLSNLIQPGGALDRLRAVGARVEGPANLRVLAD